VCPRAGTGPGAAEGVGPSRAVAAGGGAGDGARATPRGRPPSGAARLCVKYTSQTGRLSTASLSAVLGEELRKARQRAHLTQEEVAARSRITREYVSQLERDESSPTAEVLMRLCTAMGTAAWRLLRRVEERRRGTDAHS
jgi:DNA-binding XRE family transcriptional regulator